MESYIAGTDEAGRGPVIGPLVVCCAYCKREHEKKLNQLCKKDSKQLSPSQRESILAELKKFCEFKWVEISAADLNGLMSRMSLNDIEAKVMAALGSKLKNAELMIDMPDRYGRTFRKRMEKFGCTKFEAEHKADEKYPIVAAASICAKVVRDEKIEKIKAQVGFDFGSGYPSDERTRDALRNRDSLAKLKPFIRTKWKTLETVTQKKLFEGE
ncbi:ribonuclease HII [Candidatus Micrarchaeota archaeon]|nr:ribonuclease HII [Candidatus Micrarchaeota archaeon]